MKGLISSICVQRIALKGFLIHDHGDLILFLPRNMKIELQDFMVKIIFLP